MDKRFSKYVKNYYGFTLYFTIKMKMAFIDPSRQFIKEFFYLFHAWSIE